MPEEPARHFGREHDRRAPRAQLARSEPRHCAHGTFAPHMLGILELAPVTRARVPIVALHFIAFTCDHGTTHAVRGALIAAYETVAVAVDAQTTMRAERSSFGVAHPLIDRERCGFAGSRELDRRFGG